MNKFEQPRYLFLNYLTKDGTKTGLLRKVIDTGEVQIFNGENWVPFVEAGGIAAPAQVTLTSAAPTIASLAENTNYSGTNLTSLTVSAVPDFVLETLILFTTGASFTASFPATLKWVQNGVTTFEANKGYVVAIANGVACAGEVS